MQPTVGSFASHPDQQAERAALLSREPALLELGLHSSILHTESLLNDDQTIYIADAGNHRIQRWAYGACSGVTVAGTGTAGAADSQLSYPVSVTIDRNQYMYMWLTQLQ